MGGRPSITAVLRGKESSVSIGFVLLGIALVLLTVLSLSFTWASATVLNFEGLTGPGRTLVLAIGGIAVVSAGLNTWVNDGVLVSLVLASLPLAGAVGFHLLVSLVGRLPDPTVTADLPVLLAGYALLGTGVSLAVAGVNRYREAGYEHQESW